MLEPIRSTQIRGLKTGWLESGLPDNPLFLCLHGYPDHAQTWEHQQRYFSERYRVICPYTRGAGPSEPAKRWQRYSHDSTSLDLLQLIRRLEKSPKQPLVVLGHDMGAVQAWNLATYLGDRLRALVIINGISIQHMIQRLRNPRQHLRSWYIYGFQIPGVAELVSRHRPNTILNLAYGRGRSDHRPESTEGTDYLRHPINQYRAFVRHIPKMWQRERAKISQPVLMLWGKQDPFLVTPTQKEIEPFAPDLTIRILEGGHWPHRDNAREVNSLIDQFLVGRL